MCGEKTACYNTITTSKPVSSVWCYLTHPQHKSEEKKTKGEIQFLTYKKETSCLAP